MRKIYGQRDSGTLLVLAADGFTLLLSKTETLNRWAEHFNTVLNNPSSFDDTVLDEISQHEVSVKLDEPPTLGEVKRAISQMSSNTSPGPTRSQLKYSNMVVNTWQVNLFCSTKRFGVKKEYHKSLKMLQLFTSISVKGRDQVATITVVYHFCQLLVKYYHAC